MFSTGFGLFTSTFTRSQIAALFLTIIATIIPAVQFSGLLNPVSSLAGVGAFIGHIYPAAYFFEHHTRRVQQSAGLLQPALFFLAVVLAPLVVVGLAILLLKKQET